MFQILCNFSFSGLFLDEAEPFFKKRSSRALKAWVNSPPPPDESAKNTEKYKVNRLFLEKKKVGRLRVT